MQILILLLPLFSAWVCFLLRGQARLVAVVSVLQALSVLMLAAGLLWCGGHTLSGTWWQTDTLGVGYSFVFDKAARTLLLVAGIIAVAAATYGIFYLKQCLTRTRFFCHFSFLLFALWGLFCAGNLLTLLVFEALVGWGTYLFFAYTATEQRAAAAQKCFFCNCLGDVLLWAGLLGPYAQVGALVWGGGVGVALPAWAGCCFVAGLGVKSAQIAFLWPTDTLDGPMPASAVISSFAVAAAGLFGAWRVSVFLPFARGHVLALVAACGLIGFFVRKHTSCVDRLSLGLCHYILRPLGQIVRQADLLFLWGLSRVLAAPLAVFSIITQTLHKGRWQLYLFSTVIGFFTLWFIL